MATVDRIEPSYAPWSPSAAGFVTEQDYVGRHRGAAATRALSFVRMFYVGRHRRR